MQNLLLNSNCVVVMAKCGDQSSNSSWKWLWVNYTETLHNIPQSPLMRTSKFVPNYHCKKEKIKPLSWAQSYTHFHSQRLLICKKPKHTAWSSSPACHTSIKLETTLPTSLSFTLRGVDAVKAKKAVRISELNLNFPTASHT